VDKTALLQLAVTTSLVETRTKPWMRYVVCLNWRTVPYHIHVSETKTEVDDIQKQYGFMPVGHMENWGILDDKVIAAHAVHLTKELINCS
jgi:cytosine/adenosine deaminase-related metal-dependent hydrolase